MSLIATAHAATAATPAAGDGWTSLFFMLAMLVGLGYLMVWRPHSQQVKEQQTLVDGLAKGDEIITSGGLVGKITKVKDGFIKVSIAEGVDIALQKTAVSKILPKGTIKGL